MLHHERRQPPSHDYPPDEWNVVEKSKAPYLLSAGGISLGLLTIT
jgi:alpha,alpha-trehalose phosphorylase